jgi:IMP dehydrogenase/GMP reductase
MKFLLEQPLCTTEDVTFMPGLGIVSSRSEVKMKSLFYNAPMDTVASPELLQALLDAGEYAVIDRRLHENQPDDYKQFIILNYKNPNLWFTCGLEDSAQLFTRLSEILSDEEAYEFKINILVDVAHGHTINSLSLYNALRKIPIVRNLMSGSICTPDAARDCVKAGCTHLRVGVGPGAVCSTRLVTGCGIPNLSAVYSVSQSVPQGIQIIADGGIVNSGQVVKYLAAGATGVMIGTELAKTLESGGWYQVAPVQPRVFTPGQQVAPKLIKRHRGQASAEYQEDYGCSRLSTEGVGLSMEWDGLTVKSFLDLWRGGIQSAASYLGVADVNDINPQKLGSQMFLVTQSSYKEGTPHGI